MTWRNLVHISLARKCQLLFGLALALIIAAALFVPGYYMESFVHELNARRAREPALAARARINPMAPNWGEQERLLAQWWGANSAALDLPATPPRVIPLPAAGAEPRGDLLLTLLKLSADPPDWLRRTARLIQQRAWNLTAWQASQFAWHSVVPPNTRTWVRARWPLILPNVADVLLGQGSGIDPRDTFLVQAIREFQSDEKLAEKTTVTRQPDGPRVYRYVLPIRGGKDTGGRSPLIAVIDSQRPAPRSDEMILLTRAILLMAGILAGFLAILVFYLITQRLILAPVRDLKALADQIASGDLTARADLTTGDEFQELSDSFNDMLGQLERSRLELEKINRSLDAKLGELAETNVALYESNRLKSEFLANVSHELRTPLTSIIGFADLLRDAASGDGADRSRLARYATNILISGRGLLDIINDLLDLAKIEAGRIEMHRAVFSIRDVCEALADLTRPLFDKKSQEFDMDLAEELPAMNSDAGKLRQVLYNLLSNAHKYTPEYGRITLKAEQSGPGTLRLAVTDTGPGIAPEDRDVIFEKFRQLDSGVTREHSGTGLGLAITRELVVLLGGKIRLESELGRGTTFIVDLPAECPEGARRPLSAMM